MFCKFYRQFYLLCPRIKWKRLKLIGSRVKLIFKLLILGAFLGSYHRHLLSLSNESMTPLAYPKSYEFKMILCTSHSINREKDGYNLTFHFLNTSFCNAHKAFNAYIFVTGRNDSDQEANDGISNFTVHYPLVSQQKSENPAYFLLLRYQSYLYCDNNPICPKQHQKLNTRIFPFF